MGGKLTRLTESVNKTRRRVSSSLNKTSCSAGNGAAAEQGNEVSDEEDARNGLEKTGHDPALHGARLEDRNYNNESFKVSKLQRIVSDKQTKLSTLFFVLIKDLSFRAWKWIYFIQFGSQSNETVLPCVKC
ncbi:hypothetical protein PoB_003760200 [Plakobranchus ocellatus]|uniref:Uncharacterized protein n=1 Tax=Plakobranchus ocellatus TaxID=259542 RepID=A0AAV4AVS4_9GAST|nr:hypothetical protein PoB_003760200 [Plakobranchus ocellatus]